MLKYYGLDNTIFFCYTPPYPKFMNKILSLFLSITAFLAISATAFAAGNSSCQTIYGGGQVCQEQIKFTINKLVQRSGKGGGDFVENLTVNDPRYAPNQNVNFKIVVQNTGNTEIKNLNVVDNFPQYLAFIAGVGATNIGGSQVNFIIGSLPAGAKAEYVITARTSSDGNLPATQAVTCVTNNVVATATDGTSANDSSQVCIEKQVLGAAPTPEIMAKPFVKNIPATGPEMGLLFGLIPTGALGFYLRRKTN